MNLTEARKMLLVSCLNVPSGVAGNGGYGSDKLDRALQMALGHFLQETKCQSGAHSVTLSAGVETLDLSATLGTNFLPLQILHARTDTAVPDQPPTQELEWVSFDEIVRRRGLTSAPQARPCVFAFETPASQSAYFSPIPDVDYTATFTIWEQLIEWTPGIEAEVALNVPQAFIRKAIWFGATAALLYGETGTPYASTGWQRFEEMIEKTKAMIAPAGSVNRPVPEWGRRSDRSSIIEGGRFWPR